MVIPFEIRKIKNPDATISFIAVISLNDVMNLGNAKEDLANIQKLYEDLIQNCRKLIKVLQKNKKNSSDPYLHWQLGNLLYTFIDYVEKKDFYFANVVSTLARDTGISKRYISYHIKFRKEYSALKIKRNKIKWWGYQELLDIPDKKERTNCEKNLSNGKIKTQDHLRKYKKSLIFNK
jgi:hypothetical protein